MLAWLGQTDGSWYWYRLIPYLPSATILAFNGRSCFFSRSLKSAPFLSDQRMSMLLVQAMVNECADVP